MWDVRKDKRVVSHISYLTSHIRCQSVRSVVKNLIAAGKHSFEGFF